MGTKNIFITVTASVNYYLCQCLHLRYSYQTVWATAVFRWSIIHSLFRYKNRKRQVFPLSALKMHLILTVVTAILATSNFCQNPGKLAWKNCCPKVKFLLDGTADFATCVLQIEYWQTRKSIKRRKRYKQWLISAGVRTWEVFQTTSLCLRAD